MLCALPYVTDDCFANSQENKHKLLFLLEMLEPFLDPALTSMKSTISFGDVSAIFQEKQERTCAIALNVIRTAARRPAVLPSLESEWRCGSVAPRFMIVTRRLVNFVVQIANRLSLELDFTLHTIIS